MLNEWAIWRKGFVWVGFRVFHLFLNDAFTLFQNVVILSHFRLKLPLLTKEGSPTKTFGQEFQMPRGRRDKFHPWTQAHRKTTSISSSLAPGPVWAFSIPRVSELEKAIPHLFSGISLFNPKCMQSALGWCIPASSDLGDPLEQETSWIFYRLTFVCSIWIFPNNQGKKKNAFQEAKLMNAL